MLIGCGLRRVVARPDPFDRDSRQLEDACLAFYWVIFSIKWVVL